MEVAGVREPADEPADAPERDPTDVPGVEETPDAASDSASIASPAEAWGPPLEAAPATFATDEAVDRAPAEVPLEAQLPAARSQEAEPRPASPISPVPETSSSGMGIGVILGIVVALVIVAVMVWLLILSPGTTLT